MPGAFYTDGNLVRVSGSFLNAAGAAADPTTVILRYRRPLDTVIISFTFPSAPIVKDSTGNYHADLDTTAQSGNSEAWVYEWMSPQGDPVQAVSDPSQGFFFVKPRAL
jgi:hypothetical protein